jgi:thiol-disulfide isomerase/thioredoxin
MTTFLIRANRDIPIPEFPDVSGEEEQKKRFEFYRTHYFDNFDMNDPRAIRSGVMHNKIDYFTQKLSYPYPDSQNVAIDQVLARMDNNPEAFQYYLVHFLNEAAKSKRMGMDAVYVHLVYATGKATWTEEEQLKKLISQADATRPLLIGKVAPNVTFYTEDNQPVSIHSIPYDYTVLFFWDPECGHCKTQIPYVINFYNAWKDRGVQVFGICTKTGEDISSCWSTLKERGMDIWLNAADQYMRSRYKLIYDIKTTPQIFILDKDKKILAKKIGGEDLNTVMEEIIKVKP